MPAHCHLHVLHEFGDVELVLLDLFLESLLFNLELSLKFVDLLLLLVENLVLLLFSTVVLALHVAIDFSEILLVSINHLLHLGGVFV